MLKTLVLCAALWFFGFLQADAQAARPCSENNVDYSSAPEAIEKKIQLSRPPASRNYLSIRKGMFLRNKRDGLLKKIRTTPARRSLWTPSSTSAKRLVMVPF
jgi:hypothetical protein